MAWGDNEDSLVLRLPPELKAALARLAKAARDGKGLRLSEYVREVLQQHIDKNTKQKGR